VLDVGNGTFVLGIGGTLVVDTLVATNACGHFMNLGGTLIQNNPPVLDPYEDTDGDGMLNWQEAAAGTDPFDPTSLLQMVSCTRTNAQDVAVAWTTEGGHSYVVQRATNNATGLSSFADLSPVVTVVTTAGAGTTNYVHAGAATNQAGYYRVRLGP
jgi:hypothetical protein